MATIKSIEEKAKAYDEALERAKHSDGIYPSAKELKEYIFPELRESEDERMKEAIIATIHLYYGEPLEDEAKEMIAWLEKQGEQKTAKWSEHDSEHINSLLKRLEGMCKKGATFTRTRFAVSEDIDWLKSLRCQSHWKPSKEQLEALMNQCINTKSTETGAFLCDLYYDLKKL